MAEFGGKAGNLFGVGKKSLEWDLNRKWDGDLFTARPANSIPSDDTSRQLFPANSIPCDDRSSQLFPETPSNADLSNSPSSGSDNTSTGDEKGKRESEKRRRADFVDIEDESGSLKLKLGRQAHPIVEGEEVQTGKKTKIVQTISNRAVCQVEDCKADLSNAKDYHRRHKVCDIHSKASQALVGNVLQRFCQQCSRFHDLGEFDEGKRSCRRRLAGHNRRRRKAHPDPAANGGSLNEERGSSYLLISLLRILSNMHSNSSDQIKDQDLLTHLLRNLANLSGTSGRRDISALLQGSQGLLDSGTSVQTGQKVPDMDHRVILQDPLRPIGQCPIVPAPDMLQRRISSDGDTGNLQVHSGLPATKPLPSRDSAESKSVTPEDTGRRLNNIDLNNSYDDSQEYLGNVGNSHVPASPGTASVGFPSWMQSGTHKSSPPQTSGNSDLTSTLSPSSCSGEAQSRTDRIVFKLFGNDLANFPFNLRSKILVWLSHCPTEIESYIRPGCIILTIYLRLEKSMWEELCYHLGSSLEILLGADSDPFWSRGWVYTRVQHYVAFTYNGQVVIDTPLHLETEKSCRISCIRPIAVSLSERAEFVVKGFNLSRSTTRLLCALEGEYVAQETCYDLVDGGHTTVEYNKLQCLKFSCSIPNVTGRGFIEVEDHGLSNSFFPFIVAEQEVCSEICMLEGVIEAAETADDIMSEPEKIDAKNQAVDFIHELGWLLHRSSVKLRLGQLDPNLDLFPFRRFRLLMEFSIDHDWCAVVKKLLHILFEGIVDAGEHPSVKFALLDMGILHRAVRRNCIPMVDQLLKFVPHEGSTESEQKPLVDGDDSRFLFKPDIVGPMGLTPLHIAASTDGCESILDALTDDPGKVGIEAWKNARDSTELTPYDYACLRGRYSYVHIVQRKINKTLEKDRVVLDIPGVVLDRNGKQKQSDGHKSSRVASLETEKFAMKAILQHCKLCKQKPAYGHTRSLVYRPAMLSMVAVAAVCVCVALLFKSTPEVIFVFQPFRWELLKFGSS